MKRPLALIGISYFFALTLMTFIPNNFLTVVIIILGIFSLLSIFFVRKNRVIFITFSTFLAASIIHFVNLNNNILPAEKWNDCEAVVTGEICDNVFKKKSSYYYIIKVKNINVENVRPFKIEASSPQPIACETLDTITAKAYLFIPPESSGFNSKIHYRSKGIYLKGFLLNYDKNLHIEERNKTNFRYFILKIRKKLLSASKENLPPDYASVINGIMLGDKNDFPKRIKRNFDIIGTYHLLAVSGIHISIVAFFVFKFLISLKIKDKISCVLTAIFVIFFVFIVGFTPSSVRAGIMMILYLISLCIRKNVDTLTSIGISVGVICLFNPNSAIDIGLWLSFLSILSITLFYDKLKNYIISLIPKKFNVSPIHFFIANFSVSICCFLLNFPGSSWYFKKISTISFVSNIFIIIPVSVLLALSMIVNILTCLNSYIFKFIIKPLALICCFIIKYIDYVSYLLTKIPNALISTNYGYLKITTFLILILITIVILLSSTKKTIIIASAISINLIIIGNVSYKYFTKNITTLSVIPCGEGLAVSISKNGHKAFILSSTEKTFFGPIEYEFSTSNRNFIDYVNISSSDYSNIDELTDILDIYDPKNIIIDEKSSYIYEKINKNTKKIINRSQSNTSIFGNTEIKTITQNNHTYIFIEIDNVKFLLTPESGNADEIPEKWRNVDLFICVGLPQNYKKINFKNIIISESKKASEIFISKLAIDYSNIFSLYHQGNIYINVNSNHKNYQIRRIM